MNRDCITARTQDRYGNPASTHGFKNRHFSASKQAPLNVQFPLGRESSRLLHNNSPKIIEEIRRSQPVVTQGNMISEGNLSRTDLAIT
jgi:hypothetical protein